MKNCALLLCLMLLLASCRHSQRFGDVDRQAFPVKGIDVSAHNGAIDFGKVKADTVDFVIIKATEGDDFCDAMFARNFDGARQAGLKVGAYHFFRFGAPGHIQAYHFLSTIGNREPDMPLVIDVEDWKNDEGVPVQEVVDQLRSMAQALAGNGYNVVIYTNKKGYEKYVKDNFDDIPVWLSSLQGEPATRWTLWQHTHTGRVDGVSGDVDINTFNGSRADFATWGARSDGGAVEP